MAMNLQEKINYITEHSNFTQEDLLNLTTDVFETIYKQVLEMRTAMHMVKRYEILYKKKK